MCRNKKMAYGICENVPCSEEIQPQISRINSIDWHAFHKGTLFILASRLGLQLSVYLTCLNTYLGKSTASHAFLWNVLENI